MAKTVARAGARTGVRRGRGRRDLLWALFFLGPNLALFIAFVLFPILFGLVVSFLSWTILEPPTFVGLGNYKKFFFDDPLTGKVMLNSLNFVVGALPA